MKSIIDYTNKLKDFFAQKQALSDEGIARARLGVHNILPFNLDNVKSINTVGTWSGNVFTHDNGMTFTVNLNDDGTLNYIDVDGTSTGSLTFLIQTYATHTIDLGNDNMNDQLESYSIKNGYALSGGQNGIIGQIKYYFAYQGNNKAIFFIVTEANITLSHFKLCPMVRHDYDSVKEYTPYAMTNRELTNRYVIATETVELTGDGTNFYVAKTQATNPPTGYVAVGVVGVSTTTNSKIISNADIVGVSKSLIITAMTYNGAAWPTTDTATATVKVLFEKQ